MKNSLQSVKHKERRESKKGKRWERRMQRLLGARSLCASFFTKKQKHSAAFSSTSLLFDDTQLQVPLSTSACFCSRVFIHYSSFSTWKNDLALCIQFKESVGQFARENIAPRAANIDQSNSFPQVLFYFTS